MLALALDRPGCLSSTRAPSTRCGDVALQNANRNQRAMCCRVGAFQCAKFVIALSLRACSKKAVRRGGPATRITVGVSLRKGYTRYRRRYTVALHLANPHCVNALDPWAKTMWLLQASHAANREVSTHMQCYDYVFPWYLNGASGLLSATKGHSTCKARAKPTTRALSAVLVGCPSASGEKQGPDSAHKTHA